MTKLEFCCFYLPYRVQFISRFGALLNLTPGVVEWMERLYIAADGQPQKSASLERTIQDGTVEEVIRRYNTEKDMDEHYKGKM